MAFTNDDLLAIKAELTNDPLTLGYLAVIGANDEANANALNLVRVALQIDRLAIPLSEVAQCLSRSEFNAASAADRQWLGVVLSDGSVNPKTGGEIRKGLLEIFASNSVTRTALLGILTQSANRIDHLFRAGTLSQGGFVTPSDVANARNAT